MANFYGVGRTNYFRVKDVDAFSAVLDTLCGVEAITSERDGETWWALLDDNDDGGGWCVTWADEEKEDYPDLLDVVAPHLIDGDVMVMVESGHEKHRFVTGIAHAINNKLELRSISIDDIYELAKPLGTTITEAAY